MVAFGHGKLSYPFFWQPIVVVLNMYIFRFHGCKVTKYFASSYLIMKKNVSRGDASLLNLSLRSIAFTFSAIIVINFKRVKNFPPP